MQPARYFLAFLTTLAFFSCGQKMLSTGQGKTETGKENPAVFQVPYEEDADEYEVGLTPETQALMNTIDSLKKIFIPEKEEFFIDTFSLANVPASGDSASLTTTSSGWKTSTVSVENIKGKHSYDQYKMISIAFYANHMQRVKYEYGRSGGDMQAFEVYYIDAQGKIFGYEKGPAQECTYLFNPKGESTWSLCIEAPSGSLELMNAEGEPYNGPLTYPELLAKYELGETLADK